MKAHSAEITSLAFVDGALLSTSKDKTARLGEVVFAGHLGAVNGAIAVKDKVITVSDDCGVRFFDRTSGELLVLGKGHTSRVTKVAATKTGVATESDDGSTRQWKLDGKAGRVVRGKPVLSAKKKAALPLAVALEKGVKAVANEDGTVALVGRAKRIILAGHDDVIVALAVSDDGKSLASGAADGSIRLWSWGDAWKSAASTQAAAPTLERVWQSKAGAGGDPFWESGELWVGLAEPLVRLDLETGKSLQTMGAPGEIIHSDPTTSVFVEQHEFARVVDRETGKVDLEIPLEGGGLYRAPLAWTTEKPDGKNSLRILDLAAKSITTLGPMNGRLDAKAIRADGKLAVVSAEDAPNAWLWNIEKEELLGEAKWKSEDDEGAHQVAFTHDGNRVVIGTQDGRICVHDANTGERIRELVGPNTKEARFGDAPICVSPATDRVVGWGNDQHHPILFDITSGATLAKLLSDDPDSGYAKGGISFSPDGTRLVVAHAARPHLAFHDAMTGARLAKHAVHHAGMNGLQFRWLDASRVLTFGKGDEDKSLRFWNATTGERIWTNLGIGGKSIKEVIVSPRGRLIAATAWNWEFVRIVSVATGKTVADLPHPKTAYVRSPAFSADETLIATTSNDAGANLWRLPESRDSAG